MPRTLSPILALILSSSAFAQGTIANGDVAFVRPLTSFDETPAADLTGVSVLANTDHLFEHGWWYRMAGATSETKFGLPSTESYVGDHSTLTWPFLAGVFSAEESATVLDAGDTGVPGDGGLVEFDLRVRNFSVTTPLVVDIFHMADLDVNGSSNDAARLYSYTPLRQIQIIDPSGVSGVVLADGNAAHYLVRPYGGTSVRMALNDAAATNFDNSGLPFGPGDFTGGFQFPLAIPPSGEITLTVLLMINAVARPCLPAKNGVYCDGFESGSTLVWSSVSP